MSADRRDLVGLALLVVVCLLPFVAKPLHIDDPMIVWAAEQILREPGDFYGFSVNWHATAEPMSSANHNPPLASYYLAGFGALFGVEEWKLHLAMGLAALLFVASVYSLARRLTKSPRTAALVCWVAPASLLSSTTLMSDTLLAGLWCAALVCWLRGIDDERSAALFGAGLLAGLCALTKYLGLALLPLFAAYALLRGRASARAWAALAIPVAMIAAYEWILFSLYGHSGLLAAGEVSLEASDDLPGFDFFRRGLVALAFIGGALLPLACWNPWLFTPRALVGWGVAVLAASALLPVLGTLSNLPLRTTGFGFRLQFAFFTVLGVQLLWLVVAELRRSRDAEAWLLAFWIGGVLCFAGFVNWTLSVRALLPAVPAVALLLVRQVEARRGAPGLDANPRLVAALLPALAVSLALAFSDHRLAESARTAAQRAVAEFARPGATLWFQGAWGFQHYLQREGGEKIDYRVSTLEPGDRLVLPVEGSNVALLPVHVAWPIERLEIPAGRWITATSRSLGAGFHSSVWGPLPFAFGEVPKQRYEIYEIRRRFQPLRDSWERARP